MPIGCTGGGIWRRENQSDDPQSWQAALKRAQAHLLVRDLMSRGNWEEALFRIDIDKFANSTLVLVPKVGDLIWSVRSSDDRCVGHKHASTLSPF